MEMKFRCSEMIPFRILLLTGIACAVSSVAFAGPLVDLDAEISALVETCGHRSGLAVALVSHNETLGSFTYAKGFGLKDVENNVKADENTFLCIGSVTKHFTATLLVHLLDLLNSAGHQPRYSLQTRITDLDPALSFPGSTLLGVTLEDILSMRTGLADYFGPVQMGYPLDFKPRDLARNVSTRLPRFANPRQKYRYNNHVFSLGGYACELLGSIHHKQNLTWEQLTKIHLFDPLGIGQDSSFVEQGSGYADRVAKGYVTEGGVYKSVPNIATETITPMASSGAICISPKAMAVWMEFLLNKGVHQGKVIIRPEVFEETWKPRINMEGSGFDYGLGWMVHTEQGNRVVQHTGRVTTYVSNFVVYPELKHALLISSSGGYFMNVAIIRDKLVDILKRALGVPVTPNWASNLTCEAIPGPGPANNSDPIVPIESSLYAGTYSHPVYGTLVLKEEGSKFKLEMGRIGKASVQCRRSGSCSVKFEGDMFWASADGAEPVNDTIFFGKSCSGYVVSVTLPVYSPRPLTAFTRPPPATERCPVVDRMHEEIKKAVEDCGHQSGLAVAIVSRDESSGSFTYAKTFGQRDIEHQQPADENTFLCIGSVTKHFTATLLLHLLDVMNATGESPYSLQTLITDLDPLLSFPGSELIGVTLEDILSMRTGLTDYFGPLMMGYPPHYGHRELSRVSTKLPRLNATRTQFIYNNHVYALGGYACELLGSIYHNRTFTWEELTKLHLFDPLGIGRDASFAEKDTGYIAHTALPYATVGGRHVPVSPSTTETVKPAASAGVICMSPKGMAVWMEFLMNKGTHQGKVIVQPTLFEETWKGRIQMDNSREAMYALGWMESTQNGTRVIEHAGAISTYSTKLFLYPDRKYAFFISSAGGYTPNLVGLAGNILSIFARTVDIPVPFNSYGNSTCSPIPNPTPATTTETPVAFDLNLFVGTYAHPVYGSLELKEEGGSLVLRIGEIGHALVRCYRNGSCHLAFQGPLFYISEGDAWSDWDSSIVFGKTSVGYVTSVSIPMYSPDPMIAFTRSAPAETTVASTSAGTLKYFVMECAVFWIVAVLFRR